jgi:hypothetical protein
MDLFFLLFPVFADVEAISSPFPAPRRRRSRIIIVVVVVVPARADHTGQKCVIIIIGYDEPATDAPVSTSDALLASAKDASVCCPSLT